MSKKLVYLLLFFLFSLPPGLALGSDLPFQPGEKLTFLLRWEFIPAGKAVLTIAPLEEMNGESVFHFVMTAKSNSFLDLFYKVRDRIDSYTDTAVTHSILYKKNQREGKTRRNVVVNYDWDSHQARYTSDKNEREPIDILPGTLDPLGIFYYVRSLDLSKISALERPVSDGKKSVIGIGNIIKRETITVPAGTYDTLLIEPDLKDIGGVFEKSKDSKIRIWVSAERPHIPVKLKSKVAVGSFMGDLVKVQTDIP